MKRMMIVLLMLAAVPPTLAGIRGVTPACVDAGSAAGLHLSINRTTSNTEIRVFTEQQGVVLGADLATDDDVLIPAGTVVNSYIAHIDLTADALFPPFPHFTGSVTFDKPVLGVIYEKASLLGTDAILGNAASYESGRRLNLDGVGYPYDAYILAGNTLTLDCYTGSHIDEIRVIELNELTVAVDVKPGNADEIDPVNLKSKGSLPFVVFSSAEFDALSLDVTTLELGDPFLLPTAGPERVDEQDVDGDGLVDLLIHFSATELVDGGAIDEYSVELLFTGETLDGQPVAGLDEVRIVGNP